jgi:mannose-6-phosphate isomerase-like protein (cupin superfamily)
VSFFAPPHPYPPARYAGVAGAASAWLRRSDEPPDLVGATGGACEYLATGAQTDGDYGLYRWTMGPTPSGPAPHFHRSLAEAFYVLTGAMRLYDGEQWVDAGPGDFLHVPAGGVHGFRNESGAPASMLILFTPGAPRETYFEGTFEMGRTGVRPSDDVMAEFFDRHDTFWV